MATVVQSPFIGAVSGFVINSKISALTVSAKNAQMSLILMATVDSMRKATASAIAPIVKNPRLVSSLVKVRLLGFVRNMKESGFDVQATF